VIASHISSVLLHDTCMIDWRGDYLLSIGKEDNNNNAHLIREFERPVCEQWIKENQRFVSDECKWKELVHDVKIRRYVCIIS
jgi:hypothetical protein